MDCAHRITGGQESYCFLQSRRESQEDPGTKALVFHGAMSSWPLLCDEAMVSLCPFRESPSRSQGGGPLVLCPFCHRRHREGSTNKRLCQDWHSVKGVLREMRESRPPVRYFEEGTTLLPYRPDTPGLVRQLIWPRLKAAVLRRDRYTCQDCGDAFGRTRRRVLAGETGRGRPKYRWESLEVHHIVPRSRGGSDHPGNLKALCPVCHRAYTSDLRIEIREARRRESEILCRMKELGDGDGEWQSDY